MALNISQSSQCQNIVNKQRQSGHLVFWMYHCHFYKVLSFLVTVTSELGAMSITAFYRHFRIG